MTSVDPESSATLLQKLTQAISNCVWFPFDATGGDADRVDALELEVLDANRVALKGGSRAVGLVAVDLDGETLRLPIGIDLVTGYERIDRRPWQAGASHQGDEKSLGPRSTHHGIAEDLNRGT